MGVKSHKKLFRTQTLLQMATRNHRSYQNQENFSKEISSRIQRSEVPAETTCPTGKVDPTLTIGN